MKIFSSILIFFLAQSILPLTAESNPTNPEKKEEPADDAETKRLAEEARQKALKEIAEKEAADKKAKAEADRRELEEKSLLNRFFKNSKLYAGVLAGTGISLNSVHGGSFNFGATVDHIWFQRYALHLGFETGQAAAKQAKFISGNYTLVIPDSGISGYTSFDAAGFYVFPRFMRIEAALGAGVAIYRLRGGNYDFGTVFSPKIAASAHYDVLPRLQVGLLWSIVLPSAAKMQSGDAGFTLDAKQSLAVMGFQLSVRYAIW